MMGSAIDTILGDIRQPATRRPLWVYRADLFMTVNGVGFDGVGVTAAQASLDIDIRSPIHIDRVEVESCGRSDVCEAGKNCNQNFSVDADWWGQVGKHMVYRYHPLGEETSGCALYIKVYDKAALAAWGFIAFRKNEMLASRFICNGAGWTFAGHDVCQTKVAKIQTLTFDDPIEDFDADPTCGITKLNVNEFELRPQLGLCSAKFYAKGKWAGLEVISYDEVLIRE